MLSANSKRAGGQDTCSEPQSGKHGQKRASCGGTLSPILFKCQFADCTTGLTRQERNILSNYPSFATYQRNGCSCVISYEHATDLPSETLSWAYQLCERNMRAMYEAVWGWKHLQKQKELKDPEARYLMIYDTTNSTNEPVGYLHLRCVSMTATFRSGSACSLLSRRHHLHPAK